MVGLLLPVVSLGFVEGYNPVLGFVGSIPRMRVGFISYGYLFALGCILVCLGIAGVLFNQQSDIPKEQARNSPPEPPVDLPEE